MVSFSSRHYHIDLLPACSGEKFCDKFKYPDYFARGQKTELASPLPADYFNRGQSSPITAQAQARRANQPFLNGCSWRTHEPTGSGKHANG